MNNKSIYIIYIYINILNIFHVPNVQGCSVSNEKLNPDHSSKLESRTVPDIHIGTVNCFLLKAGIDSSWGSRRKRMWGILSSSSELSGMIGLEKAG